MPDINHQAVTASLDALLKATAASQQAVKEAAAATYATPPGQPPAPAAPTAPATAGGAR